MKKEYLYEFDEYSFEKVAEDLQVLNPGYTKPINEQIAFMKNFAHLYLTKPGFAGTGGFYVVACELDYGDVPKLHVKALLMGGMITGDMKAALEKVGRKD